MAKPEPVEHTAAIRFGMDVRVEIEMPEPKADRLDQPDPDQHDERVADRRQRFVTKRRPIRSLHSMRRCPPDRG